MTSTAVNLFERIFESAPDAVIVVGPDGRIMRANRQTEALFGYAKDELVGMQIETLVPERFRSLHVHHRKDYVAAPRMRQMGAGLYLSGRRKDGTEFPVDIMLSPLEDASPGLTLAVVRDNTERRRQEEQVRQSAAMSELLFEHAPDAIVVVNGQGRIVRANARTEAMFQYSREELSGLSVETLLPERFQGTHTARRQAYLHTPRLRPMGANLALFARRKDGSEVPVDIMLSPIEQGGEQLVLAVIRDITERKLAEEREKMQLELQQKELLIREVHHRVKNNLQVITSLLALQEISVEDPSIASMFRNAQTRVSAMSLLHEKLYRSTDTRTDLRFDEYLQDLLKNLAVSYNVAQSGIRLDLDSQPIYLSIDTAVPCGLLVNELVTNSLKHAFPNGRTGAVTVRLLRHDDTLVLTVDDNGIGMQTGNHVHDGGLGLQLVQSLVSQVQGTYSVTSSGGTVTTIMFPAPTPA